MHFNPRVFGTLDQQIISRWLALTGSGHNALSWWLPTSGILIYALGLNTLCCFIEWVRKFRARWRKTGEYLIHLGFVLVLVAYFWGALAGFRYPDRRLLVGETLKLPKFPGYALRLEDFEPVVNAAGRPLDMRSTIALLKGDKTIRRQVVHTNSPLTYRGLVVVPDSFGRVAEGFRFFLAGTGRVSLTPGTILQVDRDTLLRVHRFFPDAVRGRDGKVHRQGTRLGNPAIELEVLKGREDPWRGWYFLREGMPYPLIETGVRLWPTRPVFRFYSVLTINRDPGAGLALAGAMAMLVGVFFALFSYYFKRVRGDRPEIA
jgi:hypothetical protein